MTEDCVEKIVVFQDPRQITMATSDAVLRRLVPVPQTPPDSQLHWLTTVFVRFTLVVCVCGFSVLFARSGVEAGVRAVQ